METKDLEVHVHVHLHTPGEDRIMGKLQELGQTADEIAQSVSAIGTDLDTSINRLDQGIASLHERIAQLSIDDAEAERAIGVLTDVRNDLGELRSKIVDAGDNAESPVPPVEPGEGGNGEPTGEAPTGEEGLPAGTPLPGGGVATGEGAPE